MENNNIQQHSINKSFEEELKDEELKDEVVEYDKDKDNKKNLIKEMFADKKIKRNKDKNFFNNQENKVNYFEDIYQLPNLKNNFCFTNLIPNVKFPNKFRKNMKIP